MARLTVVALALWTAEAARTSRTDLQNDQTRAILLPGLIEIKRPAFMFKDGANILISQFGRATRPSTINPLPTIAASSISKIPYSMIRTQVAAKRLSGNITDSYLYVNTNSPLQWPNKLGRAPHGDFITIPDGFLPPGKTNGNMFLGRPDGTVFRINPTKADTFYHEVEWIDFNGDGLKDILTSRCTKGGSLFSPVFSGELVWLRNPGIANMDKVIWAETIITPGPDVIFKAVPYKTGFAVFTTEFFVHRRISVQFLTRAGVKTGARTIDANMGKPFSVELTDIDGDGNMELLTSNHQDNDDPIKAGVFLYEVPWANLETGTFPRFTVTQGISLCKTDNPGVGSPGFAHGFYPRRGMTGHRHIITAGDGSFDVWYSRPTGRFRFFTQVININGTTGEMLIDDFDGDGYTDVLVPDNDYWKLHVITFSNADGTGTR